GDRRRARALPARGDLRCRCPAGSGSQRSRGRGIRRCRGRWSGGQPTRTAGPWRHALSGAPRGAPAMELALKDIRRHLGKFLATIAGVAMLLAIVLVMNGIYQGNIRDGVWLIDNTDAHLWVVERGRGGPFNEASRIPLDSYKSVAATPGVEQASPLALYTAQRVINGREQQFTLIGYDIFGGAGGPGRLVQGRTITAPHFEMVADRKLGLQLGERVPLGTDHYTVVGLTSGAVDSGGNPLIYLALPDAQKVQFEQDKRAIQAAAAANLKRLDRAGYSGEQAARLLPLLSAGTSTINAVLVKL